LAFTENGESGKAKTLYRALTYYRKDVQIFEASFWTLIFSSF